MQEENMRITDYEYYADNVDVHVLDDEEKFDANETRPGIQWDYTKITFFGLTMLGGCAVWTLVVEAIRHGMK